MLFISERFPYWVSLPNFFFIFYLFYTTTTKANIPTQFIVVSRFLLPLASIGGSGGGRVDKNKIKKQGKGGYRVEKKVRFHTLKN